MLTFNVVREPQGWSIRMGEMTTPYRSRRVAIQAANELAAAIRRQGGFTQVVIEDAELVVLVPSSWTPYDVSAGWQPEQVQTPGTR